MNREKMNLFIDKILMNIETNNDDRKTFMHLEQECAELIELFCKESISNSESLRHLNYFQLKTKQLMGLVSEKKKALLEMATSTAQSYLCMSC